MEIRSFFNRIFGNQKPPPQNLQLARLLNNYSNVYSPFNGSAYDNSTVRKAVNAAARHFGKMKAKHQMNANGKQARTIYDNLNYLLSVRPNPMMTASELMEKTATQYFTNHNAFIYPQCDEMGNIIALWPLDWSMIRLYEDRQNVLYVNFTFALGQQVTVCYDNMIHIKDFFNRDEVFGEDSSAIQTKDINVVNAVKSSFINAVMNFSRLCGILKYSQTLRDEDLKAAWNTFVNSFASSGNGSRIGALDAKAEYTELHPEAATFDADQMKQANQEIYDFIGVCEPIVKGNYNEAEYIAFYESVLEPLAIKLMQEMTHKLFTAREKGFGNEVVFETNRLQYAPLKTKITLCNTLLPQGLISINEARELFGWGAVEDGDERIVSLNYVKAQDQTQYQLGQGKDDNNDDGDDEDETKEGI